MKKLRLWWGLWTQFKDRPSCLYSQFFGQEVRVRLKTCEWQREIEEELNLCSNNTAPMYSQFSNSLLGDDFNVPVLDWDYDEGN